MTRATTRLGQISSSSIAQLLRLNKLGSFDFTSRNYADDDLIVGSADPFQLFRILYEVVRGGGLKPDSPVAFMLDQCHNIEDKITGQIRSVLNVQEMTARALLVDKPALETAQRDGEVLGANAILMATLSISNVWADARDCRVPGVVPVEKGCKACTRTIPFPRTVSERFMVTDPLELIDQWGPEKVVLVSDRRSGMRGVLVIDNTSRGLGKGGTRMSPTLTVSGVARLARTMTWKWAAVGRFHGGAKAGILADPRAGNKEQVLRAFARALAKEVPSDYVFGVDMGLAEEDAAILVDELNDRGVSTGLPAALGGQPYDKLGVTGFGVAEATHAAAAMIDLDLRGAPVGVQGFGAVGRAAATRLTELGAVVVAVSTATGTAYDPDGLNVADLSERAVALGDRCLQDHPRFSAEPAHLLSTPVDVLVPAAREDTIDAAVADRTTARLIVEGANLPTSPAARTILHERGVVVVPDFIANAGGIVAAAHSTDARYSPFTVDPAQVFTMITEKLRANTVAVLTDSRARGITPRQAAMDLAQGRVLAAMSARGFRPAVPDTDWRQVPAA